jgi:hypothetical protein
LELDNDDEEKMEGEGNACWDIISSKFKAGTITYKLVKLFASNYGKKLKTNDVTKQSVFSGVSMTSFVKYTNDVLKNTPYVIQQDYLQGHLCEYHLAKKPPSKKRASIDDALGEVSVYIKELETNNKEYRSTIADLSKRIKVIEEEKNGEKKVMLNGFVSHMQEFLDNCKKHLGHNGLKN